MREQCGDLVPALRGLSPRQLEGLRNRLAGDSPLQGQAPGVQGSLGAGGPYRLRAGLPIVNMREQGGDGRGDEGSMQERLQGAWLLGIDRVEAVDRRIQPDAEF